MKKLSLLFALFTVLGLNVACSDRARDNDVQEREEAPLERAGESLGEGVEDVGDEIEDAAD